MLEMTEKWFPAPAERVHICGFHRSVSTGATGSDSADVRLPSAAGHACSVCRAAEDGNGAAVASWASPAWRPSAEPGRLLQVIILSLGFCSVLSFEKSSYCPFRAYIFFFLFHFLFVLNTNKKRMLHPCVSS